MTTDPVTGPGQDAPPDRPAPPSAAPPAAAAPVDAAPAAALPVDAAPDAAPSEYGDVRDSDWRRMHPVTPALKGWKVLVVLLVIAVQQGGTNLGESGAFLADGGWRYVIAVLVVGALVGFVYAAIAWRMTRFAVGDEAVHLHTGVLFRQQRRARLDRLQAVDVVQPVLARILGLAELRLEVAGGSGSAVKLAYLREDEANVLRAELLARAAGLHQRPTDDGAEVVPAAPAPEQAVLEVPTQRLVVASFRSGVAAAAVLAVAGVVTAVVVSRELSTVFFLLPMVLGFVGYFWSRFSQGFGFRAAISPDGIRLRHGLLEARAQTVPPGRVQALSLTQGPLWRGPDWWRVEMNVAGYGGSEDQVTENVLLPVGTREEALLAMWLVLPDLGTEDPRATLELALSGTGEADGVRAVPERARWLDWFGWRRRGVIVTDRALLVRSGRLIRRLVVVPHERTQSLALQQGPLQRRLGLASIIVHSTPGPVAPRVDHLDQHAAGALLTEQAARARAARAGAGPELWMRPQDRPS